MKQKIIKRLGIGVLAAFCSVSCFSITTVRASSLMEKVEERTDEETDVTSATDTSSPRTRANHLNFGTVQITKLANNQCNVMGVVQAFHDCDKLYLDMSLEQKSGGSYSSYKVWNFTGLNTSLLSKSINVLVPKNHYYRIKGYHAAQDSGTRESTSTQTKGVWIGD